MTHGSLFSGIGGFDLAAEWMGWENIFHCEIDPFCQKNLKYHFPNSVLHDDIKKTDFTRYRGSIDVLSGGFPCQPYSVAGKRKGKDDERHLWPEMLRAIREIQPTWVVGENVSGLINWNGGLVFDEVQTDLETEGYEVIPFILPAAGVNAPHKRDRVWFVAYRTGQRLERGAGQSVQGRGVRFAEFNNENDRIVTDFDGARLQKKRAKQQTKGDTGTGVHGAFADTPKFGDTSCEKDSKFKGFGSHKNVIPEIGIQSAKRADGFFGLLRNATDTDSGRQPSEEHGKKKSGQFAKECIFDNWQNFPTEPPVCRRNDGLPAGLDGITFSKWRNESIKAYGNAVVPQVVFQIFKAINNFNHDN